MTESAPDPASGPPKGADGRRKGRASDAADAAQPTEDPALEAEVPADDDDRPAPGAADRPVPSESELLAALQQAFAAEAPPPPPALLARYAEHARLLLEGNRRLNLTAIVEPKEVAVKHYYDCWRAIRLLPLMGRSVLDLGTGGGFPGLPIALGEPSARVVVLDSRAKRVAFNDEVIAAMGVPNATAVCDRGEDHLMRHEYDVVFLRALSSVRENVRLLRKVRHRFGDLVMFKGPSWSREVRAAEREAERLGFRLDTVWEYHLPGNMGDRALLVYRAPGGR